MSLDLLLETGVLGDGHVQTPRQVIRLNLTAAEDDFFGAAVKALLHVADVSPQTNLTIALGVEFLAENINFRLHVRQTAKVVADVLVDVVDFGLQLLELDLRRHHVTGRATATAEPDHRRDLGHFGEDDHTGDDGDRCNQELLEHDVEPLSK